VVRDDWGTDPQVRYLRQVFSGLEAAQAQFLQSMNISPFDNRLRSWREAALKLFEKAWMLSARQGLSEGQGDISRMYLHCLVHFLRLDGIEVPQGVLPPGEDIKGLIKGALR
jgi:hypothetical protein